MPVRYIFVECVSKINHILSVIHYTIYGAVCWPTSLVMIERMCILSYYHHQIGSMNYCPWFRVRSWNSSMRCMSLYILMYRHHFGVWNSFLSKCRIYSVKFSTKITNEKYRQTTLVFNQRTELSITQLIMNTISNFTFFVLKMFRMYCDKGVFSLQWHHNDHGGVWNQQPRGCLLNCLFRCRWKKTPKLRVTGLCEGNSPGPVNSPHKWPVTRKMFPFYDAIMLQFKLVRALIISSAGYWDRCPLKQTGNTRAAHDS